MRPYRIEQHPILPVNDRQEVEFLWKGERLTAIAGETISSALFGNGIHLFGHHAHDGSPQGIFCANGQCSQCMVLADGRPVKACITTIQADMQVLPMDGLPQLPTVHEAGPAHDIPIQSVPVLILGGGPAGLSAAIELGRRGIRTLLVDDKHRLGGKLVLQTHRFFGSSSLVHAGTRGIDIAGLLSEQVAALPAVEVWLNSPALAVFSDRRVGILKNGSEYVLIEPEIVLTACGAREKFLTFPGNTLPGVLGAGAFQTLVNRDLVRPAERLFIVGGGNVGLIAGYHALQAGIEVAGLVEALPECGGYKVHRDKLARMGVPILTRHTVLSANGKDKLESVTIARVDDKFKSLPGTEKTFACDSLLIAVGLDPVDEFHRKAVDFGLRAFVAGDAEEIAEASAAIISGKISGLQIAEALGRLDGGQPVSQTLLKTREIMKSKPGPAAQEEYNLAAAGVFPALHCTQEIPCDPCASLCPTQAITIPGDDIRHTPLYQGKEHPCKGCLRCVAGCPGLAITLVDFRKDAETPLVSLPYEFNRAGIDSGSRVTAVDTAGHPLAELEVAAVRAIPKNDRTWIVQVRAPKEIAGCIAGLRVQAPIAETTPVADPDQPGITCRCERVDAEKIRSLIRAGCRDVNEIKAVTRAGMGACGGKTCGSLIRQIFREEGISWGEVKNGTVRPLFVETPLGVFAGMPSGQEVR
jgi:sarcosine oxidase subunit alpha